MTQAGSSKFGQLIENLNLKLQSPTVCDLLWEGDLPTRIHLHPDQKKVVIQCFVHDLSFLTGLLRQQVIDTALRINYLGLRGRHFSIGLDSRDFLTVTSTRSLSELDPESLIESLSFLTDQAHRIRDLIQHVTLQNAAIVFPQTAE